MQKKESKISVRIFYTDISYERFTGSNKNLIRGKKNKCYTNVLYSSGCEFFKQGVRLSNKTKINKLSKHHLTGSQEISNIIKEKLETIKLVGIVRDFWRDILAGFSNWVLCWRDFSKVHNVPTTYRVV